MHNIQNIFQKHKTSWISVSKVSIDPESAHYGDFGVGFAPSEVIIAVQIQDQGSMATFDTLIQLVWCYWKNVLNVMN